MKKKILSVLIASCTVIFGCGSDDKSNVVIPPVAGSGGIVNNVFAVGSSNFSGSVLVPGYWKNETWVGLVNGETDDDSQTATVTSIQVSGSDVYAGGTSFNASGVMVAGFWKNGTWTRLGNGVTGDDTLNSDVRTILLN